MLFLLAAVGNIMLRKTVREVFVKNYEFVASTPNIDGENVSGSAHLVSF